MAIGDDHRNGAHSQIPEIHSGKLILCRPTNVLFNIISYVYLPTFMKKIRALRMEANFIPTNQATDQHTDEEA